MAGRYLVSLAAAHRKAGNLVSSAEVIEAVRLAGTLCAMRGSRYPCLQDLRDAAVTTMGHGAFSELAVAVAETEIGRRIGTLPRSEPHLRAGGFLPADQGITSGKISDGGTAKSGFGSAREAEYQDPATAILDLRRSFFLHRLRVLGISFATLLPSRQEGANWGEYWQLHWTPEVEIEIVESALLGDTIEEQLRLP